VTVSVTDLAQWGLTEVPLRAVQIEDLRKQAWQQETSKVVLRIQVQISMEERQLGYRG
jgi:hypothetical protein